MSLSGPEAAPGGLTGALVQPGLTGAPPKRNSWQASHVPTADELDALLGPWLYVPDLCDQLQLDPVEVRRLITEGKLLAIRRGSPGVLSIPSRLMGPQGLLEELPGTITVLEDAGLDRDEILLWLFTPDASIQGGSPILALQAGHKTEVRRRAQALAV